MQNSSTDKSSLGTLQPPRTLRLDRAPDGVATLWFDCAGKVNVLGDATMKELRELVKEIAADKSIKALIIASAKPDTFVSGADLHELLAFESLQAAHRLASEGQAVFNSLENLGKPTVAAIHGPCLGGGLEAALCTTRRIATNSHLTIIGLPEVRLGLIPGLGGTQRLPRLIPVKQALDFILEAAPTSPEKALELGIIDELVEPENLQGRARALALQLFDECEKNIAPRPPKAAEDPEKLKKLFALMERSVKIRLKGHYPAPLKAIDCVRLSQTTELKDGLAKEAEYFSELAFGNTSRNLIQFFFSQDFVTRSAARTAERTAKQPVKTLGIVGSGIMGMEIAHFALAQGMSVRLKTSGKAKEDQIRQALQKAMSSGEQSSGEQIIGEQTSADNDIAVSSDYAILKDCDLVLEAVLEDFKIKEAVLCEIEKHVSEDCVIATNTSALELIELGQNLKNPKRFIGTHFFYPVDKMTLVEVASHPNTSNEANARALGLVTALKKTPISVKDSTGFIVNRLLTSHLLEASRLADEGVPLNWLEEAALQFGLPMGPFTLVDELGVKLCITVAKELYASFGERFTPPTVMKDSDAAGFTGKSVDNGLFIWDASGRKGDFNPRFVTLNKLTVSAEKPDQATVQLLQDRLILPMVDEAARCLEEKVVRKARELDLAMIIGAGFPAFRGGPLRYADQTGIADLIARLQKVYEMMPVDGQVRKVSTLLTTMNEQGRRFYASGEG
ncbi:MAG: enoyl-CoA hydratase/isomerase family protein [Cyanobacteria bacterium REEB67]|nr:enoyl-CoA hydratase/isomerase family protein [Cyanobacteria bacterium REEB67]